MNPVQNFLLGVLAATSGVAAAYFFRFWRQTREALFLSFTVAFGFESIERTARVFYEHPNEGSVWVYVGRLITFLLILLAIYRKNFGREP